MTNENSVSEHYQTTGLLDTIQDTLAEMGIRADAITTETLAPVDEFHIGGRESTQMLANHLGVTANQKVLDIGCGLGGPARCIAEQSQCFVDGIDLTSTYVRDGNQLSKWVGLRERVTLIQGTALDLPFAETSYDAAYMIHVGMNISAKIDLMQQVYRVLKDGGRFVIFDIMMLQDVDIEYPLPWADGKDSSAITALTDYQHALQKAGFTVLQTESMREFAVAFFQKRAQNQSPSPLGLQMLLGESISTRISNLARQIMTGVIAPVLIVSQK